MSRITFPLSAVALTTGLVGLAVVALFGKALPHWLIILMGAMTIIACANSLRQANKSGVGLFSSLAPRWAKSFLPVIALTGAGLMVFSLNSMTPNQTPSGKPVHSLSANSSSGVCRALYNKSEETVESLEFCSRFEKKGSLVFIGASLLFGAIALWFSVSIRESENERRGV